MSKGVEMLRSKLYQYCVVTMQLSWLENCYPAFVALILSDLMFNQSLKSGLVSFYMEEVKGRRITHLLTRNYASNRWEIIYTIVLWIKFVFKLIYHQRLEVGKGEKNTLLSQFIAWLGYHRKIFLYHRDLKKKRMWRVATCLKIAKSFTAS